MTQPMNPSFASVATGALAGSAKSAASWGAIIAGAFVAASLSLVLLALGSGLGFAALSPWTGQGMSATAYAVTTAIWLIVMQWLSSGVGGYITGRLRTKWVTTHPHEVFFRDTAHGLIMWSVATVVTVSIVAGSLSSALGMAARATSTAAGSAAQAALAASAAADPAYGVDKLLRNPNATAIGIGVGPSSNDTRTEVLRIVANGLHTGGLSDSDRTYLAELVAARTGIPQSDAQKRVDETMENAQQGEAKVKQGLDSTRKAAAEASIYLALSMLVGAFIASVAAALGGRLRDLHP